MLGLGQARSEDQPVGQHAAGQGLVAQVAPGMGVIQQPQHTAGHLVEQAAPHIENLGRELPGLVEARKNKRAFGQAQPGPVGQCMVRIRHPAMGLVAVGHAGQGLGVVGSGSDRGHKAVADQVVHEALPGRARVAQEAHLHRRRAMGQQHGAAALGIAFQIHEDVHAIVADERGRLQVAQAGNVIEAMKRRHQPLAHALAVVLAVAVGIELHMPGPVGFQHLDHQQGRSVLVKIPRQIADLQRPGRPGKDCRARCDLAPAPLGLKARQPRLEPAGCAATLGGRINARHGQQQEGRPHRPIRPRQIGAHPIRPQVKVVPFTPGASPHVVEDLSACRHVSAGFGVHAEIQQDSRHWG